jgi:hypothetical protein
MNSHKYKPSDIDFNIFASADPIDWLTKWSTFKQRYPAIATHILDEYKPVFDKSYALKYWLEGTPPPTCKLCGCRINVSKRQSTHCKKHGKGTYLTYDEFNRINPSIYHIEPWDGYQGTSITLSFICPTHGRFNSSISRITRGDKCAKCPRKLKLAYTTDEWISKCREIHCDKYEYSNTIYDGSYNQVTIICPMHGEFTQQAIVHSTGHGCPECAKDEVRLQRAYTTIDFINTASAVHNNKYDYSKTVYTGIRDKLLITCPIHGDFTQVASYHTAGNGCQKCGNSKIVSQSLPEFEISEFLSVHNIAHLHPVHIDGIEIDIYMSEHNIGIEFNGCYWHSCNDTIDDHYYKHKHINKSSFALSHDIQLLHVTETEWQNPVKQLAWKSHILRLTNNLHTISDDYINIISIDSDVGRDFINNNCISQYIDASHCYGIIHDDVLVAVCGTSIVGEHAKILQYAIKNDIDVANGLRHIISKLCNDYDTIVTLSATVPFNLSIGSDFTDNGFTLSNISEPNGYYWRSNMKHVIPEADMCANVLSNHCIVDTSKTIHENAYIAGFRMIWDCGNLLFERNLYDN